MIYIFSKLLVFSDNLAREKPTSQSSVYRYRQQYAHFAVDGIKGTHYTQCAITQDIPRTTDPWWRVDLDQVIPVSEVYILNRGDSFGDRLNGAEIRVGKHT